MVKNLLSNLDNRDKDVRANAMAYIVVRHLIIVYNMHRPPNRPEISKINFRNTDYQLVRRSPNSLEYVVMCNDDLELINAVWESLFTFEQRLSVQHLIKDRVWTEIKRYHSSSDYPNAKQPILVVPQDEPFF